jgi:hypothetical protein
VEDEEPVCIEKLCLMGKGLDILICICSHQLVMEKMPLWTLIKGTGDIAKKAWA